MQADVVRVTLPDTVHHLTLDELRVVMDPDHHEYPSRITLFCDECDLHTRVEAIVNENVFSRERLAMGRAYLRTLGWACDEDGDYCPNCTKGTP